MVMCHLHQPLKGYSVNNQQQVLSEVSFIYGIARPQKLEMNNSNIAFLAGEGGIEVEDGEADCYYKPHSGLAESQPSPEIDHLM